MELLYFLKNFSVNLDLFKKVTSINFLKKKKTQQKISTEKGVWGR